MLAHHDHIIRQARLVGAACGGVAVNHGDLGNAGGRHPRLVGKAPGAQHENVGRIIQIGAAAFGHGYHGKLVLHGDLLQPQRLVQTGRGNGAAFDGAVAGNDEAANATDIANTGDDPAAGHAAVLVVVHLVAGQGAEFQERRATIQQTVNTVPREQLAPLGELFPGGLRQIQHLLLNVPERGDMGFHGFGVGAEVLGLGAYGGFKYLHVRLLSRRSELSG